MSVSDTSTPIFIVGTPRSGTTLLAAMLGAHSRLSCGTETRFFRFLSARNPEALIDPAWWPDRAIDFLFSLKLVDVPVPEHYQIGREQMARFLSERTPSIPHVLSALTEQFMSREGKHRWIEKSPEHLKHVRDIRRHFPQSPIVQIVRDARDVALSLNMTPWAPPDFVDALLLWRSYDLAGREFFERDSNCVTIRYEALLRNPERELRKLCEFTGESFEPGMLDTSQSAGKLVTKKDSWHPIVHKAADPSRIAVWKTSLTAEANRLAEAVVGDRLLAYGYECVEQFDSAANVYPSLDALVSHREALAALVERRVRFWTTDGGAPARLSIYAGAPATNRWLRHSKPGRWADILHVVTRVLRDKLSRRRVYWVRTRPLDRHASIADGLLARLFGWVESPLETVN